MIAMNNFKWSIGNKHDWTINEDDLRCDNWSYYSLVNDNIVPIMHIHSPFRVGPNFITTIVLYGISPSYGDKIQFCKELDVFYILDKQDVRQYKIEQII